MGKRLGVSQRTVYYWVSHIINRAKANREAKAWHLSALGWTQREIGERLGAERSLISLDVKNCSFAKIHTDLGEQWNEQGVPPMGQLAYRTDSFLPRARGRAFSKDQLIF